MICPNCGEEYSAIGRHWRGCGYPELSEYQEDLVTGLLLGDAYINEHSGGGNANLRVKMANEDFLSWLYDELDWLASKQELFRSGEESASHARSNGLDPDADGYQDIYEVRTTRHPRLTELRDEWYGTGEKVVPDVDLNPTVVRVWYVCDGYINDHGDGHTGRPRAVLCHHTDGIDSLSSKIPFDTYVSDGHLYITGSDTTDFFEWMGDPLPGFGYKWLR
jgi:hypothetical protein